MNASTALASSVLCAQRRERRGLMAKDTFFDSNNGFHQGIPEVRLAASRFLALPDQAMTLICLEGELWLTRDGDIEDYILGPGQRFSIRRGDLAAIQALRPSRIRMVAA